MSKILENSKVYAAVCVLFVLAICTSIIAGGSIPAFGTGLLPPSVPMELSQSPLPPPPPQTPPARVELSQSPLPPPPPQTPPARVELSQSPLPPPPPQTPPVV
jgi:hypothetical protein